MGLTVHFEVLNQLGTPMMYSATLANRPAAGIAGRIFFRTDSPFGIFRDNGTGWDQIGSAGGGNTIYTGNDTLTSNRTVSSGGFTLTFTPQTTFFSSLIPAVNASSFAVLGSNTLTYPAAFSSNNIGNVYSANGAINSQIFDGNATFAQANLASAMINVNKIDFSSGGHTVTMTQSSGIRAMTGVQNQIQFVGSHNGTITHAAVSQNLGFFRDTGSTKTLTITNAYSHLINALDDYGAGFTFTNRWGVYQAGATDINYFAASALFGTTVNAGFRVDINGTARINGAFSLSSATPSITLGGNLTISSTANPTRVLTYDILQSNLDLGGFGQGYFIGRRLTANAGNSEYVAPDGIYNVGSANISAYNNNGNIQIRASNNGNRSVEILGLGALGSVLIGGISTGNSTSYNAIVRMDSTTQGFMPPRMTTAQKNAIVTPTAGLIVYDSTLNKLCVYTTAWETVTSI